MPRINLFGGPGVGKSTLAARIFTHLKERGANVELVQEFVKRYVYEGRRIEPWHYVYTLSSQFDTEHRLLRGGVETLVTDSPLLLQCFYARHHGCPVHEQLTQIALTFEREHASVNFLLRRSVPYREHGRNEQEEEAQRIDDGVRQFLDTLNVRYLEIDCANSHLLELLGDGPV